jgi:hypothetical protein
MNAKVTRSFDAYFVIVQFLKRKKITEGRFGTARETLERCIANARALFPKQSTARAGRTYDSVTRRELRARIR